MSARLSSPTRCPSCTTGSWCRPLSAMRPIAALSSDSGVTVFRATEVMMLTTGVLDHASCGNFLLSVGFPALRSCLNQLSMRCSWARRVDSLNQWPGTCPSTDLSLSSLNLWDMT
jgi:hypothetical protein